MQTATPEADAKLVTSTLNLDIKTLRPSPCISETAENFTHPPALVGAQHQIHPPSAGAVNQSDVGAAGAETSNEHKKSAIKITPSLSGENLTQGLSNDPPTLGPLGLAEQSEGAAQLEASAEETGNSDQKITSSEVSINGSLVGQCCNPRCDNNLSVYWVFKCEALSIASFA